MKTVFKILLFALLPAFFGSCKSTIAYVHGDNATTVTLSDSSIRYNFALDSKQYIDSVRWVKLETTEDNLIAKISELFITDDWIIVLDGVSSSILFFDHDGNYSHKINRQGRGPQEYQSVGSLMIDEEKKYVIVYDIYQRKLIRYDYVGNCISTIENFSGRNLARDVINLNTGGFLCYRQDYSAEALAGVWKVDENGEFAGYIYQITESYPLVLSDSRYTLYRLPDNKIGFVDQNRTDVYHIDGDAIQMKVRYELPGKIASDFAGQEQMTDDYYMIMSTHEKGGFILTEWSSDNNKGFVTIFSKATGLVETGALFHPEIPGGFILPGRLVRNNTSDIFTMWTFLPNLKMWVYRGAPDEVTAKIEKLFEGMTDTQIDSSNPVIQLLYVKH